MNAQNLTERYVDAAMRTVPESQREDLAIELRASIGDQVDARVEAGESPLDAERAVLTDLGDPDELAAGYTERVMWLIGPRYFLDWWRLLKLLLWIVPASVTFAVALGMTLGGEPFGEIIGTTVVAVLGTIVHLGFWTTLVFALLERTIDRDAKTAPLAPWSLERLPELRQSGATFVDLIATIVMLLIAAGAILWDHFIGFVAGEPQLALLDPSLWPWWIAGLFLVMALEIVLMTSVYLTGRWTMGHAIANAALAVVAAVPALWLLAQGRLINLEFWTTVVPDDGAHVGEIIAIITGFTIAGVMVWDIIDGFLKAHRSR